MYPYAPYADTCREEETSFVTIHSQIDSKYIKAYKAFQGIMIACDGV
jgi:hypothetical protein